MIAPRLVPAHSPRTESVTSGLLRRLAILLWLVAVAGLSIYWLAPPAAVPATAPAGTFASGRAMAHLAAIAQAPHAMGTPAHEAVRSHLVQYLSSLGLKTEVQETTVATRWSGLETAGTIQNVIAQLPGTEAGGKAVVLMAHYDSVPMGNGAGDTGAGVAALLETARALTAGPAPRNDIIFLFTDGEEFGLLGAKAYVEQHPLAPRTGVVFNFEGQGPQGVAYISRVLPGSGKVMAEFGKAVPVPLASSLSGTVYSMLPFGDDMRPFEQAGYPGLGTVILSDMAYYHTRFDSLERTDERVVQAQGEYALGLARHFGNLDLESLKAADQTYFNPVGRVFVSYPQWLALPFALLLAAGLAGVAFHGIRRGRMSRAGLLRAVLGFGLGAGAAFLVVSLFRSGLPQGGPVYYAGWYMAGFTGLAVAGFLAVLRSFRRRLTEADQTAGVLAWWTLAALASAALLPGGSYIFTWPPMLILPVLIWQVFAPESGWKGKALGVGLAAPVLFMVVPFLYLLGSQLGAQMAPVAAVLAAFATGLMTPVLDESDARLQWALPALALLVGLGCLFTGTTGGTDAAHPRTYDLSYSLNGDSGQAHWLTFEGPNAVTAALFPSQQSEYVPARQHVPVYTERSRIRQAAAPAQPLAAPEASVLEDRVQDGVRHLTLQVRSPRGASELLFLSTDLALLEASVGGQVAIKGQQLQLRYVQPPAGGIRLDLKLKAGAPFKLQVTDHTYGLPAAIAPQVPSGWMPRNSYYVDSTFVTRTWTY